MTPEKIKQIVAGYRREFEAKGIPKIRIDTSRTFKSLSSPEALAHANFLLDGIMQYVDNPEKQRKTGSHLTAVQMILSYEGWYTLGDLLSHNRPDSR